jgi:hypothetical protein
MGPVAADGAFVLPLCIPGLTSNNHTTEKSFTMDVKDFLLAFFLQIFNKLENCFEKGAPSSVDPVLRLTGNYEIKILQ